MTLNLTALGNVSDTAPKTFFRVETWNTGRRVADFTTQAEAERCARNSGTRYDHKVVQIRMVGR